MEGQGEQVSRKVVWMKQEKTTVSMMSSLGSPYVVMSRQFLGLGIPLPLSAASTLPKALPEDSRDTLGCSGMPGKPESRLTGVGQGRPQQGKGWI